MLQRERDAFQRERNQMRHKMRAMQRQMTDLALQNLQGQAMAQAGAADSGATTDGLNPEILEWALVSGDPNTLMGQICLAGDAEARLKEVRRAKQRRGLSPRHHHPARGTGACCSPGVAVTMSLE
uniref:Uncharacterized protein n=1 Tax=Sphaerodactylus townsendi TaxID=933632 RepID=A0ACB8F7W7_9SAUR